MFWNFCAERRHDVNIRTVRYMTSGNLTSHVLETRKFVMAILHWKQELFCDKIVSMYGTCLSSTEFIHSI